jgi:hypothetical protein
MKKIPDTNTWQPRKDVSTALKDILYKRCLHIESLIIAKAKQEQELNINNFDSGISLEDIIRDGLSKLLPERYYITKGIVNDRLGFTSGDQDIIIFNKQWFPILKTGVSDASRKFHFPIEGIYAIGEIKQKLTIASLDEAMKKLVTSSRLHRPKTEESRIAENRELAGYGEGLSNPLYTFIIASNYDEHLSIDEIFNRFFEINKTLKRNEIINSLCILQKGTITWAYFDKSDSTFKPAMFCDPEKDLLYPILPILLEVDSTRKSSLFDLIVNMFSHLNSTILGSEDLAAAYGNDYNTIKTPPLDKYQINPK